MARFSNNPPGCAVTVTAATALAAFMFGGCKAPSPAAAAAPTSLVTRDAILGAATVLQQQFPGSLIFQEEDGSMLPNFGPGAMVTVAPARWEDLAKGQPVVFKDQAGRQILRRLTRIEGDHRLAKADNIKLMDNAVVTRENLVGVVLGSFFTGDPTENH